MNSIQPREANKFEKEEELLLWLEYESYLKQQIQDFECGTSERESEEGYSKYTQEEEHEILERIEQLKEKLVSTKVNNSIKENLLINVDLAVGLKEELEKPPRLPSELLKLTSTRDELTLEYMNLVEGLRKSKQELLKSQLSNQELLSVNQQIMKEIILLEKQSNSEHGESRNKETLRDIQGKYEISRNILQNIILQSGVNWSKDEHLRDIMLLIGDE